MVEHNPTGKHILIDIDNAEYKYLNNEIIIVDMLDAMCRMSGATEICKIIKKFSPQGITALLLLEESHISIHTYPEFKKAYIDIFTCGSNADPISAVVLATEFLGGVISERRDIPRGVKFGK